MDLGDVPQNIKNSLFSERIDKILDEIREEAGITSVSLLPRAYYDLISKEVPAHFFVETLAETGIGGKIAASIAKAIKERILESERYPLFRWGIDISEIKVSDAEDVEKLGLKEYLESEEKTIQPESTGEVNKVPEEIPIIRGAVEPETKKTTDFSKPFILQEKPGEEKATVGGDVKGMPAFSFGFFKSRKLTGTTAAKTVRATVESPEKKSATRVVHYTEGRSTLTPFEPGGEFLKTEEIAPIAPSAGVVSNGIKPAESATTAAKSFLNTIMKKPPEKKESPEKGPQLEGNIIDLRNQPG